MSKTQQPPESATTSAFELRINEHASLAVKAFRKISRSYALFHFGFAGLFAVEFFLFLLFFSFFTQSTLIAYSIGAMLLTVFSYFGLRFYLNAKKPEQLIALRNDFLSLVKEEVTFPEGEAEYYLTLVHAIYRVITQMHLIEYQFCSVPKRYETLSSLMEKLSAFVHWRDAHHFREMLLFVSIRESINLVKIEPTDLEAHASLANAYRALSKVYLSPLKQGMGSHLPWIPKAYDGREMTAKFQAASSRAIEEYKIIDEYAPNDPWVHDQLASIYHDLEMVDEEIREYEAIQSINPKDKETLFRLGALYFSQGKSADGLRIYERLKRGRDRRAELLISLYHAYSAEEYDPDNF